jgi:hypothetical protein
MRRSLFAISFLAAAGAASAQTVDVGYPPPASPFRDLEFKHEATVLGGYYLAAKDPARVAPQSAPMIGIRYDIAVGGPAEFVVRFARVNSKRNVINPLNPRSSRNLGLQNWPVYLTDLGFALNLTGQRSWHSLVPSIYTGVGVVSDLDKQADNDPFNIGTTFAFSLAGGLRFVPAGKRFQVKAEASTHWYQLKYPTAYYSLTSDNTTVLADDQAKNFWKRNLGLTLGASYLLFR